MTETSLLGLVVQVLAGVSLAASCGLRAFLPPFVVGLAVRLGATEVLLGRPLELNPAFAWLSSTPALVVFGVAVVVELVADKVPVVDHALDVVQTLVRPLAGMLVVAASLRDLPPLPAAVIGLILGGSIAGGVHLVKAKIRLLSTLGTGGAASPVLSGIEDLLSLVGSVLAVLAAVLAALVIGTGLWLTWRAVAAFRRRVTRIAEDLPPET